MSMPRSPAVGRRLATALAWRPEWPATLAVLVAWATLACMSLATGPTAPAAGAHAAHGEHAGHLGHPAGGGTSLVEALVGWAVMCVAMMVPLTLPAVRHVAYNSLRVRRPRAIAIYLGVFVAGWVLVGLVAIPALGGLRVGLGIDGPLLLVAALAGAAIWQLTPAKRRALFACRRTVPLPPLGPRADAACARYGIQQATRCLVACGPIMLAMALVERGALAWMAGLTAIVVAEALPLLGPRLIRPIAAALALAAGLVALGL
ncbi:MAG TPA: DUF2182 domain-containing protein [Aldersonia sp.]